MRGPGSERAQRWEQHRRQSTLDHASSIWDRSKSGCHIDAADRPGHRGNFSSGERQAGGVMAEGGAGKGGREEPGKLPEEEEDIQVLHGAGHCKWFNVRMGFGFISMTSREGSPLENPVDVFVHQSKLYMEGFRSLKEGEPVEFTFKKSSKGLESLRVTGPGGNPCIGSERRIKGKMIQKRKPKGDRCYNCGGLDHHAKECNLPPQPKKCHYCQSITHMVANCPHKTVPQHPAASQGRYEAEQQPSTSTFQREGGGAFGYSSPSYSQEGRSEHSERSSRSPQEASLSKISTSPEEQSRKGPSVQKRKKT